MMLILRSFPAKLAYCLALFSLVSSSAVELHQHSDPQRYSNVEQIVLYDINKIDHDARTGTLKAEGYRPTSLDIYGPSADARYASIWTKQNGTAYETTTGVDETAYNAWVEQWRAAGYVSTRVSATGNRSDALFAGVMQQLPQVTNWIQICGLDNYWNYENSTGGLPMIIRSTSMYGAPKDRQYCVLGHENTAGQQQTVFYQTDSNHNDYDEVYATEIQKRYWRPVYIDISGDGLVTSIFDDTSAGRWIAFANLTSEQLKSELAERRAQNLFPIHISGGGNQQDTYTAIFTEHLSVFNRKWHATGAVTGFSNNTGVTEALDSKMRTFMVGNGVRQAQLAASLNGTVIASRAYTWAEEDRAIVEPTDKFLLASVSKLFTHAATNHLISTGLLNLTTRVYPLLGYNEPADKRSLDITVEDLLNHTAGYDRTISPDIGFIFTDVARSMNLSTPATLYDIIEYVVSQPLEHTPGQYIEYSNYGAMLLSYVISNLTGSTYYSYLKENVLMGADVDLYATSGLAHVSDRIVQEAKDNGHSSLSPMSDVKVPRVYGGDGSVREQAIGSFGLRASAATVAQFIGHNAVWGIGGRMAYNNRDGSLYGARTFAASRQDLDWALTLNTREFLHDSSWENLVFGDLDVTWDGSPLIQL